MAVINKYTWRVVYKVGNATETKTIAVNAGTPAVELQALVDNIPVTWDEIIELERVSPCFVIHP